MYTEIFPYSHSLSQEIEQLEDFPCTFQPNASMASTMPDYDLGMEWDLFKVPEPIIEEPMTGLDPMTDAISMISSGWEVISPQDLKIPDIESSIDFGQLLNEVFYECKNDILAKEEKEQPLYDVMDVKFPAIEKEEHLISENNPFSPGPFRKSFSSGCLNSMDSIPGTLKPPNFLDFHGMDLDSVYGMRRAFSEGDLKTLGNDSVNHTFVRGQDQVIITSVNHTFVRGQDQVIITCTSEDRMEKLLRYRNKKAKRNFGRKIKYACRKALADSQPRIRGRFAKTEQ